MRRGTSDLLPIKRVIDNLTGEELFRDCDTAGLYLYVGNANIIKVVDMVKEYDIALGMRYDMGIE